jgi:hypothetical protein
LKTQTPPALPTKAKREDAWIELIDTVFKRLKKEPQTASSLARQLELHYYRIEKVLNHLAEQGAIQRLTIQVRWPTGHVTPTNIYYHPKHKHTVLALRDKPQPLDAQNTNLPCLQASANRQTETITLLKNIMKNH